MPMFITNLTKWPLKIGHITLVAGETTSLIPTTGIRGQDLVQAQANGWVSVQDMPPGNANDRFCAVNKHLGATKGDIITTLMQNVPYATRVKVRDVRDGHFDATVYVMPGTNTREAADIGGQALCSRLPVGITATVTAVVEEWDTPLRDQLAEAGKRYLKRSRT